MRVRPLDESREEEQVKAPSTHPPTHRAHHTHSPTHPPTHGVQHLVQTASSSSIHPPTHPPTHLLQAWEWQENVITQTVFPPWEAKSLYRQASGRAQIAYGFDHLFNPTHSTQEIYNHALKDLVRPFHPSTHPPTHPRTHTLQGAQPQHLEKSFIPHTLIHPPPHPPTHHRSALLWEGSMLLSSHTDKPQQGNPTHSKEQPHGPWSHSFLPTHPLTSSLQVRASLEGIHATVFAYGQTATGKTHTLQGTTTAPGVIPLAIYDCFAHLPSDRVGGYG